MSKILAIRGDKERGKEVIALLEMLGGKNQAYYGKDEYHIYFIDKEGMITTLLYNDCCYTHLTYQIFTLEEFLEKYPFKVNDKVIDKADGCPGVVCEMKWDEDVSDMKYCVAFGNGVDFGWFVNDSIEFCKENKNLGETRSKREYDELRMPLDDDDKLATEVTIMGKRILPPDGYLVGKITQTDNGMLVEYVNKKPKYPKTYRDCFYTLYGHKNDAFSLDGVTDEEYDLIGSFIKLKRCRDAYWRIAGEQMGLNKPWKPEYVTLIDNNYHTIQTFNGEIDKSGTSHRNAILAFPTVEMRDVFYENFKVLIENCKELL